VLLRLTPNGERVLEAISRANITELKAEAEAFRDLLDAIQRLEDLAP
jgi:hypothetical protein